MNFILGSQHEDDRPTSEALNNSIATMVA